MNREDALALLCEYTQSDALRKHMLAVEAAVRAYAEKFGEDVEKWGIVGLLHDFDYERWPTAEDHPYRGAEVLKERGYPEWFRKAILSHAPHTGVPRETPLEHCLFAADELCGFLTACAYVQPDRAIASVKVKSVRKKMKSKAFARTVNRDDIVAGAAEIGMDLDEHIAFVLDALVGVADDLGLAGGAGAGS